MVLVEYDVGPGAPLPVEYGVIECWRSDIDSNASALKCGKEQARGNEVKKSQVLVGTPEDYLTSARHAWMRLAVSITRAYDCPSISLIISQTGDQTATAIIEISNRNGQGWHQC